MKNSKGFSLIELVMVIVLTSIVFGFATVFLNEGFKSYTTEKPLVPIDGKTSIVVDQQF